MSQSIKRIAVTGGAGQIAYSILFRIARGELLGENQPIALHILEIPPAKQALDGVVMELNDCAFPLLKEVHAGTDPNEVFAGVDYALLIGAKPRGPGMERKDLLQENAKIFIEQGKALDKANPDVLTLVVGNPCNTNSLIACHNASKLDPKQFFAMTRLDENRAKHQLAAKAGVDVKDVSNMTIWGNHSATQVPDFFHAKIGGKAAGDRITDQAWLEGEFITTVQKRGAAIIAARGKSSAASAASAAIDAMRSLIFPTPSGEWFSMGVHSGANSYGIDEGLIFSFPCISKGEGKIEIVSGMDWNPFLKEKIAATEKELVEERTAIQNIL